MNRFKLFLIALLLICAPVLSAQPAKAQTADAQEAQTSVAATASSDIFVRALYRHVPVLRYDSGEDFFPVRAESITNNVGNKLLRENGAEIAERVRGGRGLSISYLRGLDRGVYPNGDAILETDKLDERGNDLDDYRRDASQFQNSRTYGDRIYGRIVRLHDHDGRITGAWLQYWFFYYYNDSPSLFGGNHEGDWEMIQVKVDARGVPLFAVYAHHTGASKCGWSKVLKTGARPRVFVARGSHASYFRTGSHGPDDDNNGQHTRRLRGLIRIGSSSPRWIKWPGFWGSSSGSVDSPKGPKFQSKHKWDDPELFFAEADLDDACK